MSFRTNGIKANKTLANNPVERDKHIASFIDNITKRDLILWENDRYFKAFYEKVYFRTSALVANITATINTVLKDEHIASFIDNMTKKA